MKEEVLLYFLEKIKEENDGENIDFVLPGYVSRPLIAYQSIREDLLLCLNAAKKILEINHDDLQVNSLWITIIILYGKCFTDATASKSSKLEIKDCFDSNHSELLKTHNDLMHLRHNFVAHRGSTENEYHFAYLRLNVISLTKQVKVKQIKRTKPSDQDISNYILLFNHLVAIVEKKFEKSASKVWGHMLENFTAEEISKFKISGPQIPEY